MHFTNAKVIMVEQGHSWGGHKDCELAMSRAVVSRSNQPTALAKMSLAK